MSENILHFQTGSVVGALVDAADSLGWEIEFKRNCMRRALERKDGDPHRLVRIYCAQLRVLRRTLRDNPVLSVPAWAFEENPYWVHLPAEELVARYRWLKSLHESHGVSVLTTDWFKASERAVEYGMARRWLEEREARGARLAAANRARAMRRKSAA